MDSEESLFTSLEEHGWAVSDDFMPQDLAADLLQEAQSLWQKNAFQPAHIGKAATKSLAPDIRGDSICWLNAQTPASARFLEWAEDLRQQLNQRYFLGLNSEEFHFARYPTGKGYDRHIDQHRGTRQRKISLVLYLNPEWQVQDGGELVIYSVSESDKVESKILPSFARLVLFRSDLIPHEVLPCFQTRWSLTGWFRAEVQSFA
jgi:SM-20-related protein